LEISWVSVDIKRFSLFAFSKQEQILESQNYGKDEIFRKEAIDENGSKDRGTMKSTVKWGQTLEKK